MFVVADPPRRPRVFTEQVTQEVSHPVATPKKACTVAGGPAAEPKSPTTATSGDTSAAALAVERPLALRRSISQPIERGKGRAAAIRKVTLFERCTTTTLESSSSSLSTEDGNDNGKQVQEETTGNHLKPRVYAARAAAVAVVDILPEVELASCHSSRSHRGGAWVACVWSCVCV